MTGPGDTGRPAFDPRHDPRFQRGYRPGDARPEPAAPDAPADVDAQVFDRDDVPDEPEPSRGNPFIALLWLIGVLFVAGAVTLQWQSATYSYASYSYDGTGPLPLGMLIQQVTYLIAPSMLTVGLAVLAGLLFWHAHTWRARRRGVAGA